MLPRRKLKSRINYNSISLTVSSKILAVKFFGKYPFALVFLTISFTSFSSSSALYKKIGVFANLEPFIISRKVTPLIMVTSSVSGEIASPDEILGMGFLGFVMKPYQPKIMKDIILFTLDAVKRKDNSQLITRHTIYESVTKDSKKEEPQKSYLGVRALVADDMKVNLMLVVNILKKRGCNVDSASNGKEALTMYKKFKYDVVFMDCHMPEMDGYEATKAIRVYEEKESKIHTPIIAITADAMKGNEERCLQSGMDDYLNKPVKAVQIEDMIDKWVLDSDSKESEDSVIKKILIADDNDVNRTVLKAIIAKKHNYNIDYARNGEEAVTMTKKEKYDMIFMDYHMPIMSGIEAAKKIRRNQIGKKNSIIIALTGDTGNEIIKECKDAGMDDYLNKPLEEELVNKVFLKWFG